MDNEFKLVDIYKEQVVTTSLSVAKNFDKEHKHVLRDIREIISKNEKMKKCFYEGVYTINNRSYKKYYMNRDGFTILVMGFSGKKAFDFKVEYIEAFNQMEKQLKELLKPSYMIEDSVARAERWIAEEKQRRELLVQTEEQSAKIIEMQPTVDYAEKILKAEHGLSVSDICNDYPLKAPELNTILEEEGFQYSRTRKGQKRWYLTAKLKDRTDIAKTVKGFNHSTGYYYENLVWFEAGRKMIYEVLKKRGIHPNKEVA